MSIIRTDYMTPMSNIGAIGNSFAQTVASTVSRIPGDRQAAAVAKDKAEVVALEKEKLLKDKKYYQGSIDAMINDIQTMPVGSVPFKEVSEMRKLTDRLEFLKENQSEKAFDEVSTIAKNFGVVASTRKQFGDEEIYKGPYLTYNDAINPKFTEGYLASAKSAKATDEEMKATELVTEVMAMPGDSATIYKNLIDKSKEKKVSELVRNRSIDLLDKELKLREDSVKRNQDQQRINNEKEKTANKNAGNKANEDGLTKIDVQIQELSAKTPPSDNVSRKDKEVWSARVKSELRHLTAVRTVFEEYPDPISLSDASKIARKVIDNKPDDEFSKRIWEIYNNKKWGETSGSVQRSDATPQTSTGKKYTVTPITTPNQ